MRLSKLIASSKDATLIGDDVEILALTADSRKVTPGSLFVAIPGTAHDGRTFIDEALKRGAAAVLAPTGTEAVTSASLVTTPDIRRAISALATAFHPRQPDHVAAVTGTSGKTSTAQFVRELWQELGFQAASIGTLGLIAPFATRYGSLTTPDAITLHALLDECATEGVTHLSLEASSHGLSMHRLDDVQVQAAGFTNLSRDHLDYHATMENYLAAKMRLFTDVVEAHGTAVLNADIVEFEPLTKAAQARHLPILSYGRHARELRLIKVEVETTGQRLTLEILGKTTDLLLPVIGSYQVMNALCALGLVIGCGADAPKATAALEHVSGVPGRLELGGQTSTGGTVFVDYAHKPDALENVLKALRQHVAPFEGAKLGVVFGCGGNRDKGKRPLMGSIADRYADWSIVTDDNPRSEEASTIRKEVLSGYRLSTPLDIGDRAKAIEVGIEKLQSHDVLVVAGKGHEPGQIVGDKILPFDDMDVVRKVLER